MKRSSYDLAKIILTLKPEIVSSSYFQSKKAYAASNFKNDQEKVEFMQKTIVEILSSTYSLSIEEAEELLTSKKIEELVLLSFCKDIVTLH